MLKNDTKIFTIGYLEDITTEEDKEEYFKYFNYKKENIDEKEDDKNDDFI